MGETEQKGPDMAEEKGGNGSRALGGLLAIVAVIAGVYAMVEPMNQRIDYLERQLSDVRHSVEAQSKDNDGSHQEFKAKLSALNVQFREVEAKMAGLREIESYRWEALRLADGEARQERHASETEILRLWEKYAELDSANSVLSERIEELRRCNQAHPTKREQD